MRIAAPGSAVSRTSQNSKTIWSVDTGHLDVVLVLCTCTWTKHNSTLGQILCLEKYFVRDPTDPILESVLPVPCPPRLLQGGRGLYGILVFLE